MIAPSILSRFSSLNPEQRRIVETTEGPVLIIAGPGSGKTFSLVLRTLNLLCLGKAKPSEIVVCTFTEKAALELRDRLNAGAAKIGYKVTELRVGTIHGICHEILNRHRHHTKLGNSFQILDGLTQQLFLFEQFETVFGPPVNDLFLGEMVHQVDRYRRRYFILQQNHRGADRRDPPSILPRRVPLRAWRRIPSLSPGPIRPKPHRLRRHPVARVRCPVLRRHRLQGMCGRALPDDR